jgi:hydrogenase expression/formation protein HypC
MCLAIPGRVLEKIEENGLVMGLIDYAGMRNKACLAYTPEAEVGNYVIVHAGFALQVLNEDEAEASLRELGRLADIMAEDAREKDDKEKDDREKDDKDKDGREKNAKEKDTR